MNLAPRKRYTLEFKAQAVELLSTGKPVSQVAEELCISSDLLYSWRHSAQGAQLGSAGVRAVPPAIEQIAADAELFGDLGNRLASAQKFNGLRFELGGISLAVD